MDSDCRPELSSDLSGVVLKTSNLASSRSLKLTGAPSGKLTPRASALNSPSFRRSSSFSRVPKRVESRSATPLIASTRWIYGLFSRRNIVPWLLLIGIWSYMVFLLQYHWVDSAGNGNSSGYFGSKIQEPDLRLQVIEDIAFLPSKSVHNTSLGITPKEGGHSDSVESINGKVQAGTETGSKSSSRQWSQLWPWRGKKVKAHVKMQIDGSEKRHSGGRGTYVNGAGNSGRRQVHEHVNTVTSDDFPMVVTGDPLEGRVVGPFGDLDEKELIRNAMPNACKRHGLFAKFVKGKTVVVVLHELSMTGAPLAVIDLASEMISCKAKVSAVVLNRKGGLLQELADRGIRVINDKTENSWKVAAKADLVVAGSASCSSWIGPYLAKNEQRGRHLVWWIMENRQEYFQKAKLLLGKVQALIFISESQAQLWREWCESEKIKLASVVRVVPLSINDDLATLAGVGQSGRLSGALTIDIAEEMAEKRRKMRFLVRRAMGLDPDDMLVISMSSINPGKGQHMLVLSALLVAEGLEDAGLEGLEKLGENVTARSSQDSFAAGEGDISVSTGRTRSRKLSSFEESGHRMTGFFGKRKYKSTTNNEKPAMQKTGDSINPTARTVQSSGSNGGNRTMKVLIGSLGSKSNKIPYVEKILGLVKRHPILAGMMFWTKASVHVAPLYAAADVYVMNAQGVGETFGRVTIEAMAFGVPVLGTDAGGTREIVEHNVTGLLHPLGRAGIPVLAQHLKQLLDKPSRGKELGQKAKEKVAEMYREGSMYESLATIFSLTEDGSDF